MSKLALAALASACLAVAQPAILPLRDIKAGMKGVGRTVFSGDRIEEFQADILGVLENSGPRQSIILARLSGGPIAKTGVMQGMSGSPVYVDGKLIGAVALAFTFATDPIAGIRPIEEMLDVTQSTNASPRREIALRAGDPTAAKLVELATPVSFSGFSEAAVSRFAPELRKLGLEPMQGALAGGGANTNTTPGDRTRIKPGSMISVQLMTGDMAVAADGTVTMIDGDKLYAFGHRFLSEGVTEMPFARSEVIALLPNINTSFKISTAREHMGVITQDRNAAIAGTFGGKPTMVPVAITVRGADRTKPTRTYNMQMVRNRTLLPMLAQMAIFSSIDGTERTLGPGTLRLRGTLEFDGGLPPIRLDNAFASDMNAPALAAAYTSLPISYALQSGIDTMQPKSIRIDIEAVDDKKSLHLDQAWVSAREVRPGDAVEINLSLTGENGAELFRKVQFPLPVGMAPGPLYFTISDGMTANFAELLQSTGGARARTPSQVAQLLNSLRPNDRMLVRVWRAEPSYGVPGGEIPDPPASVGLVLARLQSSGALAVNNARGAKVAEIEVDLNGAIGSGSKTLLVEVKEPQ
ncbi:hypothetical protein F183_A18480 [Bryobacterales bacterium F-183]|nr:hypothetical protein F183_A18480 [Bryobacterales bacterium F-183]